ncbi:uncharacterized protein K452DRAFT_301860 [Aplosporella prunicola CBS 121167]|uniref:Uncharacterized protein n=1 Tax=Aplosporella prunicola CBS 121167 TaxID=1176127 RepID=A0A6A6B394_9PEZI|nr:uncharacterized protein K452DRAFT_301860 [Aplosporella prunicola CBS 121167]KAF2137457.1 hypothetical protein K452DRAFT_301860 [Aplosporella prunicola CBS 121167]
MSISNGPSVPEHTSPNQENSLYHTTAIPSARTIPSNRHPLLTRLMRKHKALLTRISYLNTRIVNAASLRQHSAFNKNAQYVAWRKWERRAAGLYSVLEDDRDNKTLTTTPKWRLKAFVLRRDRAWMRDERLAALEQKAGDRVGETHWRLLDAWDRLERCEIERQALDPGPLVGEYWAQAKALHALEERRRKYWAETHALLQGRWVDGKWVTGEWPTVISEEMQMAELRRQLVVHDGAGGEHGHGVDYALAAAVMAAVDGVVETVDDAELSQVIHLKAP